MVFTRWDSMLMDKILWHRSEYYMEIRCKDSVPASKYFHGLDIYNKLCRPKDLDRRLRRWQSFKGQFCIHEKRKVWLSEHCEYVACRAIGKGMLWNYSNSQRTSPGQSKNMRGQKPLKMIRLLSRIIPGLCQWFQSVCLQAILQRLFQHWSLCQQQMIHQEGQMPQRIPLLQTSKHLILCMIDIAELSCCSPSLLD